MNALEKFGLMLFIIGSGGMMIDFIIEINKMPVDNKISPAVIVIGCILFLVGGDK